MTRFLLIYALTVTVLLTACHHHDEPEGVTQSARTVLVYMSAENNLSEGAEDDLNEMLLAKTDKNNDCLLVYVDDRSSHIPYLARVSNGFLKDSVSLRDMGISKRDTCSSDPGVMLSVINYAFRKYPSRNNDYGLVLWGHASGWVIEDSVSTKTAVSAQGRRKAYGLDNGVDVGARASWINIYSLAQVLKQVPHLKYIFADCCNFQCLETLYALRDVADYIIGSPAEIPGVGAPYTTVVPALFEPDSFYTAIIDRYYELPLGGGLRVPLSAVKTSNMAALADATRQVLLSMKDTLSLTAYPNTEGLIHYYYSPLFHDANDFVLRFASSEAYAAWKQILDETVVYKKMAAKWMTNTAWQINYSDFQMSEERYGGVSMFVPQSSNKNSKYRNYNADIKQTAWYGAAGLANLGW